MAIAPLRLPRLPANQKLINDDGTATMVFSRWWQSFAEQIEGTVNGIQSALDAAGIAQEAAMAANAAAANADAAAGAVSSTSALANSYVSDLTISAEDAGTSVTITVSDHERTYATSPPTTVSVLGGTITGVPYSVPPSTYTAYIYYDQASRAGGAVSYQYSADNSVVAQINDRHSVGSAISPAAAGDPIGGSPIAPPGGSYRLETAIP